MCAPRAAQSSTASVTVAAADVQNVVAENSPAKPSAITATIPSRLASPKRGPVMASGPSGRGRSPLPPPGFVSQPGVGARQLQAGSPLVQSPAQALLEGSPARVAAGVVADLAAEGVDLGVEVVQVMEGDGLERHRQLRAAELVRAVMADDHVLEPEQQVGREGLARQLRGALDFLAK